MSRASARRALAGLGAGVVILGTALLAAGPPAQAATEPIGVSTDGVSFAANIASPLFAGAQLVPGGTITRSFWVRNQESTPGHLAVTVGNVSGSDALFLSSLSIGSVDQGGNGSSTPADAVGGCTSLLSGTVVPASGVVRVDVALSLSSALTGVQAQGSAASFDLGVMLTSTDVPAPDGCTAVVPPTSPPEGNPGGGANPVGGSTPRYSSTTTVSGSGSSGAAAGPGPSAPRTPQSTPDRCVMRQQLCGVKTVGSATVGNTGRFYQELTVLWWIAAFLLGGLWAIWAYRRQEQDTADPAPAVDFASTPMRSAWLRRAEGMR